jgi:hypothetical protein
MFNQIHATMNEGEYIDIDSAVEAIREAWKCVPDMSLEQVLEEAVPAPLCEVTNTEMIDSLNEFILQNQ